MTKPWEMVVSQGFFFMIERMGIEMEKRDGMFYPLVDDDSGGCEDVKTVNIGK